MIKKIKHITSFILCFCLIVSISTPSYVYAKNVPNTGNTGLKFTDLEEDYKAYSVAYMYYDIWRDGVDEDGKPIYEGEDDDKKYWTPGQEPGSYQTAKQTYNLTFENSIIKDVKVYPFDKIARHEQIWNETRSAMLEYAEFSKVLDAKTYDIVGRGTDTVNFEIEANAKLEGGFGGTGYTTLKKQASHDPTKYVYGRRYYIPVIVEVDLQPIDDGGEITPPPIDLGDDVLEGEDIAPQVSAVIKAESQGAEKFDVTRGIPTSEYQYIKASSKNYLYSYRFSRKYEKRSYPITVRKTYIQHYTEYDSEFVGYDDDGDAMYESVEYDRTIDIDVSESYDIERGFSYWEEERFEIDNFKEITVENYSLPGAKQTLTRDNAKNGTFEEKEIVRNTASKRIIDPEYEKVIDLGSEDIGESDPPSEDFESYAESAIGQILVTNDDLTLGGESITSIEYVEVNAPTPDVSIIENNKLMDMVINNLQIRDDKLNGIHESKGYSKFSDTLVSDFEFDVNRVVIHTPVVIDASTTDSAEYNQQINPTNRIPLVLDRPHQITIGSYGTHRDIKGYGTQDYEKYIKKKQVKFPFDVYFATTDAKNTSNYVKANQWINLNLDLGIDTFDYYIPPDVDEGEYTIEYRTIAINAPSSSSPYGHLANMNLEEYVAYETSEVEVIGRIYGFKVTDLISDKFMPGIRNQMTENLLQDGKYYYPVGFYDRNGKQIRESREGLLPVLPGSSDDGYSPVIKQGYRFAFEVKAMGNYFDKNDGIQITPTFYHVDDYGYHTQVDVYVKNPDRISKSEFPLIKIEEYDKYSNCMKLDDSYRKNILKDRWEEIKADQEELGFTVSNNDYLARNRNIDMGYYDEILLSAYQRTYDGDVSNLPAGVDPEEVKKHVTTYYGEYALPADLYVVPKGFNIKEAYYPNASIGKDYHGFSTKEPYFMRTGHLMVNFDIVTINDGNTTPVLSYDKMWDIEGYQDSKQPKRQTPVYKNDERIGIHDYYNGRQWYLNKGDVIAYNLEESITGDMRVGGTH